MRRGAEWAVLLAVVCLALGAWVTTSGETPVLHGAEDTPSTQFGPTTAPVTESVPTAPGSASEEREVEMSTPLYISMYVLLILAALALFAVVWHPLQRRLAALHTRTAPDVQVEPDDTEAEDNLTRSLTQITTAGMSALVEGSPRNAIVRCWLALEETVEQAGLTRDPTKTSAEFTAVVLAQYSVRVDAIRTLSELYREARFSEHELTEGHRERAIAALEQLRSELVSASTGDDRHPSHPAIDSETR